MFTLIRPEFPRPTRPLKMRTWRMACAAAFARNPAPLANPRPQRTAPFRGESDTALELRFAEAGSLA